MLLLKPQKSGYELKDQFCKHLKTKELLWEIGWPIRATRRG